MTRSLRERSEQVKDLLEHHGEYPEHSGLGHDELFYMTGDGGILCAKCANKNLSLTHDPDDPQWYVTDVDSNWERYEGDPLLCDNCYREIEPIYGYLKEGEN